MRLSLENDTVAKVGQTVDTMWIEALGILAGTLTTGAYLPQVLRTKRTRSVRDISFLMYAILALGIGLWIVYGVLVKSVAVILANSVSLVMILTMLAMKIRYDGSFRKHK